MRFGAAVLALVIVVGCNGKKVDGGSEAPIPSGATLLPRSGPPDSVPTVPKEPERAPGPSSDITKSTPLSFAPIARVADPSVVTIQTIGEEIEASPFGSRARRRETKGLGTGFLVDKDGTILTNNHVIDGADTITVKLSDDKEYPGRVLGRDPRTDIAVIKVDAKDHPPLTPLVLGDSDAMEVGDWVVAIGNPFGLSHTVSAGIVSAKGRTNQDVPLDPAGYYDFLQTDASINPGNSGGPLLNLRAEVVGINSAIRGGGAQGIGFAIPVNMVKQLLPMLLRDGHVTRSAIGVRIRDVHELAPEDKAALKLVEDKGAVIEVVSPDGPAEKAGLRSGDVILAFDSQPIDRGSHLTWLASTAGVGKTVTLRISRLGKVFEQKVTLMQLPEKEQARRR